MDRNRKFSEMASGSSNSNNKQTRFSIHDAFEEENDEAIRVYGSTVVSNPIRPPARTPEDVTIRIRDPKYVCIMDMGYMVHSPNNSNQLIILKM